jgi:restriction endonuclease S subunit
MTVLTFRLGDVAEQITDGTHLSPNYVDSGIPMLDSKHIKNDFSIDDSDAEKFISIETDKQLAQRCKPIAGDILISSRGTIGKIAIVKDGQNFNIMGNMILVRLGSSIDKRYFLHYLRRSLEYLVNLARGVAQKGLYLNQVRDLKITIPPLAEQQRIAALLDTADQILKTRESAIAKLDQLAQSVFLNELRAYDFSSFQLAEVAEMYQPKTISANELIENGEYVVYGANGVIGRYDKFNHSDSEVLITCRGATCGTVNRSQPLAWITGNAMVVKPLNNIATKDFLHYYFKFVADFSSVITGAAQPQITRQTLSRLMIQLPKLENQNKITIVVREIYKKHELMNLSKNKLQELTSALQHQSFAVN